MKTATIEDIFEPTILAWDFERVKNGRTKVCKHTVPFKGVKYVELLDKEACAIEWKAARRDKVGASEVYAIMGKSEYKTRREVWSEKVNGDVALETTPSAMFGNALEATLLQLAGGFRFDKYSLPYSFSARDPLWASPDGIAFAENGEPFAVECKTGNSSSLGDWIRFEDWCENGGELGIGDSTVFGYYTQATCQMLSMPFVHGVIFSIYIDNRHRTFVYHRARMVPEFVDLVLSEIDGFWRCVQTKVPPPPQDPAEFRNRQPIEGEAVVVSGEKYASALARVAKINPEIKRLEKEKKELIGMLAEAATTRKTFFDGGSGVWIQTAGLDIAGLKRDHPDIVDKYERVPSRYFRVYPGKRRKGDD